MPPATSQTMLWTRRWKNPRAMGVGQGEPAGAQDEGEQGLQVPDSPHHFFGEFAADFPNRGRLDELYKDAQIVQQDEESSTMEVRAALGVICALVPL